MTTERNEAEPAHASDSQIEPASRPDSGNAAPAPQPRRLAFRLFTFAFATLLATAAVIVVAAFLYSNERPYYFRSGNASGLESVYDSQLGWRNIPNSTNSTFGHPVAINAKGLRDRDYPWHKPAGVKRIVVLGDSYVWGYGVDQDAIFTEVLERSLGKHDPQWEVINTGVSGWGTDQEYLYLREEGFRFSPDIVVVAYFIGNDTHNCLTSKQYGISKPVFLDTSLKLANVPVPDPRNLPQELHPSISTTADPIDLTVAILRKMGEECAARHCKFVFMKFGMFHQAFHTPDFIGWNERLIAETPRLPNVYLLDLDAAFAARKVSQDELLRGNFDGHWNAFGHQVTAEILETFLVENHLLE